MLTITRDPVRIAILKALHRVHQARKACTEEMLPVDLLDAVPAPVLDPYEDLDPDADEVVTSIVASARYLGE